MGNKWIREHDGMRRRARTTHPTLEEREAAKQDALKRLEDALVPEDFGFQAYCPCCNRHLAIPTEWASISEVGVCKYCNLFLEGKFDSVQEYREPTIEEALAEGNPGRMEVMVLKNAVRDLMAEKTIGND